MTVDIWLHTRTADIPGNDSSWKQLIGFIFWGGLHKEWEDTHGKEEKLMNQAIFLPHQILGCLFAAGKLELIAGNEVP